MVRITHDRQCRRTGVFAAILEQPGARLPGCAAASFIDRSMTGMPGLIVPDQTDDALRLRPVIVGNSDAHQAPGFYHNLGYREFIQLQDNDAALNRIRFRERLA